MTKKIVIVGALGYLGTELCKSILVKVGIIKIIRYRFISERVKQLKD